MLFSIVRLKLLKSIKVSQIIKNSKILCFFLFVLVVLGGSFSHGNVSAGTPCRYKGKLYPEGTVIGDYICKGGKWVRL